MVESYHRLVFIMDKIKILSLIPLDDLIEEAERRCETFVCAYELPKDKQITGKFNTYYGKGTWFRSCALTSILHNDCINSWNGELKTLSRINEEEG